MRRCLFILLFILPFSLILSGCGIELIWLGDDGIDPNLEPVIPGNPSPSNNGYDPGTNITLSWICSDPDDDPLRYDLYFGTTSPPELLADNLAANSFNIEDLTVETTYYWQIVVRDDHHHEVEGPIWSFTTSTDQVFSLGNTGHEISMVRIPSGYFTMGATADDEDAVEGEFPSHQVNINNDFWLAKYELTQEIWSSVMGEWNFHFDGTNNPVDRVTWDDVKAFIDSLNADEGSETWRLPSEAEWEYACRARTTTRFFWGNDPNNTVIEQYAWYSGNSSNTTHPVGHKQPNPWGLYDMIGNVNEWCEDDYHENYNNAPSSGNPWIESPRDNYRIHRGGSYNDNPANCRSSMRFDSYHATPFDYLGFRLVRSIN